MMERSYSNVLENLKRVRFDIDEAIARYGRKPDEVRLMAVTKTVPAEAINAAIDAGVDLIGENKAQELLTKYDDLKKDSLEIHFIGHLQSNKVRQIIDKVGVIQSVDRLGVAREISAQAAKIGKTAEILMEVNIGGEQSKSGVEPEKLLELIGETVELPNIKIKGLMTIPPFCDDTSQVEQFFYAMRQLLIDIKGKNIDNVSMDVLSMGMSGDFVPAIKHGATVIRVGSAIFGERNYSQSHYN